MILRPFRTLSSVLLSVLFFSVSSSLAVEDAPFNCRLTVDDVKFDLTSLAGEHIINQTHTTPPTSVVDSLRFDLCNDLKQLEGVAERDQCSSDTRACLTKVNKKPDEADRVVSVIPIIQRSSLAPVYTVGLSSPKFISLMFQGPEYPHPTNSTPVSQSLNLTVLCDPQDTSEPKFISYDGAIVQVEWSAPAGCPSREEKGDEPTGGNGGNDDNTPKDENRSAGSGIGWFFLMLLLAFAAYFGLGAYYNYSTYGARGADLIPHRDFWKEVPYMLSDVVSHLCSTVRPRRPASRSGYIAV